LISLSIPNEFPAYINEIMEWSRKWRININADKTEYCIFFRLKQHPGHTILKLNYKILKYNRNPKLLGVTLDEKLNFGQHILNIERKAGNAERNQRTSSNKNKIYVQDVVLI
jgi:hypothetical protein